MKSVPVYKTMFIIFLGAAVFFCVWSELGVSLFTMANSVRAKNKLCNMNSTDHRHHLTHDPGVKIIYFVTPTYPRPEQIPELTRLSHTLMHVPRLHWIVADDQETCSDEVVGVLRRSGLPYTHLASPKPYKFKGLVPRGVSNRRAALQWLRENTSEGVLYFGDDDNSIDLRLFDEIRRTKRVSMFPVGLVAGYGVSSPIVKDGKVVGFYDSWPASRTFPVDMAGFAVNLEFLTPAATMPYIPGHEEDKFLVSLGLHLEDIEPLADNCSKVLVWHTRTLKYNKPKVKIDLEKLQTLTKYQSFVQLLKQTSNMGMATLDSLKGVKPMIIRDKKTYDPMEGLV